MTLRYTYHSEHHADRQDRWVHFLLFAAAFLLLAGGLYELFLYFTDWNHEADSSSWWHLLLASLYLIFGGLLAFAGIRHVKSGKHHPNERYVRIDDEHLRWHLNQQDTEHSIELATIRSAERLNVRELILHLRDGSQQTLPIYLITNPEKQEELIQQLNAIAAPNPAGAR